MRESERRGRDRARGVSELGSAIKSRSLNRSGRVRVPQKLVARLFRPALKSALYDVDERWKINEPTGCHSRSTKKRAARERCENGEWRIYLRSDNSFPSEYSAYRTFSFLFFTRLTTTELKAPNATAASRRDRKRVKSDCLRHSY